MVTYEPSTLQENERFLEAYRAKISIPYDDFLEEYILKSEIFSILLQDQPIGFFGKFEHLATIFFIEDASFHLAREIFEEVKQGFSIREAFVPTTDLGFLSVALERYAKLEIQAYHFTATDREIAPPEYSRDHFRAATLNDLPAITAIIGDFWDHCDERIREQTLYVLEDDQEIIGVGIIVKNLIMKNCQGTGMFTKETKRNKGVGRSIIIHLHEICRQQKITSVPGCWYYNIGSKKTLESAGYISQSQLLHFTF